MSQALKGALLSALAFPGVGQIVLKSYVRGVVFAAVSFACLATVVGNAVQQARAVLDAVAAAGGAVDLDTISNAANEAVTASASRLAHAALLLLILSWALSTVDAYRVGRKADAARA